MRTQIQRTAMIGLLVAVAVAAGGCQAPQLDVPCGDERCPNGQRCVLVETAVSVQPICVVSDGCGNGIQEVGEQCDDGNSVDGDGCDSNCTMTACGNGVVTDGEMCDDGNIVNFDGCQNDCTVSLLAYITASNAGAYDEFGYSIALSADGSTLAVGAYREFSAAFGIGGDQTNNSAPLAGAVYVFTRNGTMWSQQAYIKASNTDAGDQFGYSIALSADGSTLAVGATGESSATRGIRGVQDDNSAPGAGAVYLFTRSGTTWSQQAYVKASNTDAGDQFGSSVALSRDGSTLAVGATEESSATLGIGGDQASNSAPLAGAAYLFTRSGTMWTQQAYIKASNTDAGGQFGYSIALSADGSTLAVGAPEESSATFGIGSDQGDDSAPGAGAVYLFTRSGTTWSQQVYIKASNTDMFDLFGWSVALSADDTTLAVGARGESSAATGIAGDQADNTAPGAGATYLFTRSGTTWTQQAYIKASNTDVSDVFGWSVALSANGSTLAVGAIQEASGSTGIGGDQGDNSAPATGAVYLFTRSNTTWTQQAYIKAFNANMFDLFGYSVALSADGANLGVGAYGESSAATGIDGNQADYSAPAGAVYVFY